jgi:hypothetical protein
MVRTPAPLPKQLSASHINQVSLPWPLSRRTPACTYIYPHAESHGLPRMGWLHPAQLDALLPLHPVFVSSRMSFIDRLGEIDFSSAEMYPRMLVSNSHGVSSTNFFKSSRD